MQYFKQKSGFALIDFTLGAMIIMIAFLGLGMLFYHERALLFPDYDAKHDARRYYAFAQAAIAYVDENLGQGQFGSSGEVQVTCSELTGNTNPATGSVYLSSTNDCYDSFGQELTAYVDLAPPYNGGSYPVPMELLVFPQSYNDTWNNTMHWNNTGAKRAFYVNTAESLAKLIPSANFGQTSGGGTYNPVTQPLSSTVPINQLTPDGTVPITLDPQMNTGWFMYYPLYCEQTFVDLADLHFIIWGNQNQYTSSQNQQLSLQQIYQQYFSPQCSYQQFMNLMYRQNPPYPVFYAQTAGAQGSNNGGYGGVTAGTISLYELASISNAIGSSNYDFYIYTGQGNGVASAIYFSSIKKQNLFLMSAGGGGAGGFSINNNGKTIPIPGGNGGGNNQSGTAGGNAYLNCGHTENLVAGGGDGGGAGIGGTGGITQWGYANYLASQYCSFTGLQDADNGQTTSFPAIVSGNSMYTLGGAGYGSGGSGGEVLCIGASESSNTNCMPTSGNLSCNSTYNISCSSFYVLGGAGGGGSYAMPQVSLDYSIGGAGRNSQPNGWAKLWLQLQ